MVTFVAQFLWLPVSAYVLQTHFVCVAGPALWMVDLVQGLSSCTLCDYFLRYRPPEPNSKAFAHILASISSWNENLQLREEI